MNESDKPQSTERPWAIRRWCMKLSLILAAMAQIELIVTFFVGLSQGNREPLYWIICIIGPIFYALVYGIAYMIAYLDQFGPVSEQSSEFMFSIFSTIYFKLSDKIYPIMPNILLIIFSLFMNVFSGLLLWGSLTNQLNHNVT